MALAGEAELHNPHRKRHDDEGVEWNSQTNTSPPIRQVEPSDCPSNADDQSRVHQQQKSLEMYHDEIKTSFGLWRMHTYSKHGLLQMRALDPGVLELPAE